MNDLTFMLGNTTGVLQVVPPPNNWRELQLAIAFLDMSPDAALNATDLIWEGQVAKIINQWFNTNGLGEGIPLRILICDTNEIVFDGICDLSDPETLFNCDIVKTKIRDKRNDMLTQLLPSIPFSYLATPISLGGGGIIDARIYDPFTTNTYYAPTGDYIPILYQNNSIPDYLAVMITALSIFSCINTLITVFERVVAQVSNLAALLAGVVTAGAAAALIIAFAAELVELYILINIIIDLLEQMYNNLIAPVYVKLGMNVWTCFKRICQNFGYKFSSSISLTSQYENLVIMPAKQAWAQNITPDSNISIGSLFNDVLTAGAPNALNRLTYDDEINFINGGFAYGYPDGDAYSFVKGMEEVFNAEARIVLDSSGNPTLTFERWDYQQVGPYYTLPNITDDAPFRQSFSTNASEWAANYQILWQQDGTDYNTYLNYTGTSCYCTSAVKTILVTQSHVTLQNLVTRQIPFAQGSVKQQLTAPEQLLEDIYNFLTGAFIYQFVNKITFNALNLGSNPSLGLYPKGLLLLSGNTTGVPKLLNVPTNVAKEGSNGNGKGYFISQQTRATNDMFLGGDPISAANLMKYFHWSSLPLTVTPPVLFSLPYLSQTVYGNQWYTYNNATIPLCCSEYNLLQNNNVINTFDGKLGRMDKLDWTLLKGTAAINYRVLTLFNPNISTVFTVDGYENLNTLEFGW